MVGLPSGWKEWPVARRMGWRVLDLRPFGKPSRRATQQMHPTGLARRDSASVTVRQQEPRPQNARLPP